MPRTAYHTHIKSLVRDRLLPADVLRQIPRSNIHRWMSESQEKYTDFGLTSTEDDYETIRSFVNNKSARRVYAAYVRILKTVLTIVHTIPQFRNAIREAAKQLVPVIKRGSSVIGLKRVLRIFNISLATFRNWSLQSFTACFESATGTCNRVFPSQLSRPEILKLKTLLTTPDYQYWPVSSIALHALRRNILPLSLNTWYKYVRKLGLSRPRPASRRKKNVISIRACHPHQLWHADITVFITADQVKILYLSCSGQLFT